jgi:hypothetical protein
MSADYADSVRSLSKLPPCSPLPKIISLVIKQLETPMDLLFPSRGQKREILLSLRLSG